MKKRDRRTPVLSWALKLGFQCTRIKFSQGPCLSQETENPQQHLKVSCFPGTSPFAWCEWVTDWKCRPGSGTHQLQAALSQRRAAPPSCQPGAPSAHTNAPYWPCLSGPGKWLSTALGAAWVFMYHTTYHSQSESPRPGNPGPSKGHWSLDWKTHFGHVISCCLHSWVLKQKSQAEALRTSSLSPVSSKNVFLMPR